MGTAKAQRRANLEKRRRLFQDWTGSEADHIRLQELVLELDEILKGERQ